MTHFRASDNDVLGSADATELAARIHRGEISAGEAVAAAIARLQRADPVLSAIVCERFDAARAQARKLRPGNQRPFAGVPSVLKDNTDLAGLPTRHGSHAVPAKPADANAAFAEQFQATGLIPLAKTRLPEFGLTATTEFAADEPVRNPWHTAHSTGGSSGGSAALVAAGVVPIAHANDGGGSIRIPAACCGLVGLKVSRGRVAPNAMAKDLPIDIIADGVVSHSVRDTARFVADVARQHGDRTLPPIGNVTGPGRERLRIGFTAGLPDGGEAHADCVAAMHDAAALCAALGHHVEPMASPLTPRRADDFLLYYAMICASLAHAGRWLVGRGFRADRLEPLTQQLASHFRRNALRFPAALWRLKRALRAYEAATAGYDVVLTPTLGRPPPPLGYLKPDLPFDTAWRRLREYAAFTPTANVCGTPAISLPLGMNGEGLPIGVQFAAGMGQERRLLELAFALEEAAPWPHGPGDH